MQVGNGRDKCACQPAKRAVSLASVRIVRRRRCRQCNRDIADSTRTQFAIASLRVYVVKLGGRRQGPAATLGTGFAY
jgi:hypothetical protein